MNLTEEIYERIKSEQIIENKGYRWYVECCLNFVEREILPTFWHLDFYAEMGYAWSFLAQKISAERLFEMEKIAYENIENFEGQDRAIACLIRWCLNGGLLSVPEQEEVKKSKLFGAKHQEIIITDYVYIFLSCLQGIDNQFVVSFYDFLCKENEG